MNWFERLMGFAEESPSQVRSKISLDGATLVSAQNGQRVGCGRLSIPSLAELRRSVGEFDRQRRPTVREVVADVGALHRAPDNAGALFQAASQFNLLEMAGPNVTPEEGVGIYKRESIDRKPGPGMLLKARDALGLDMTASALVGDRETDIEAAIGAGVGHRLLIDSPEAPEQSKADAVVDSLAEAVAWLAGRQGS